MWTSSFRYLLGYSHKAYFVIFNHNKGTMLVNKQLSSICILDIKVQSVQKHVLILGLGAVIMSSLCFQAVMRFGNDVAVVLPPFHWEAFPEIEPWFRRTAIKATTAEAENPRHSALGLFSLFVFWLSEFTQRTFSARMRHVCTPENGNCGCGKGPAAVEPEKYLFKKTSTLEKWFLAISSNVVRQE